MTLLLRREISGSSPPRLRLPEQIAYQRDAIRREALQPVT
jgi:hypothetical protein